MERSWGCWIAGSITALALWLPVPGLADSHPTPREHEPIRPIVALRGLHQDKVALGRALFFDPILSQDGSVSCASCHDPRKGGADGLAVSRGVGGAQGSANAPTVFNTFLNAAQFWDGRATSLEAQVDGPILNPVEMHGDWPGILARLAASPHDSRFRALYGHAAGADEVREVLATYERSLATVNSPFDRWLAGDEQALTESQKQGYALFKSYGCASCHQGANVGGNMFQKFGFFGNWLADRGPVKPTDLGRYNVTGRAADRFVFKVPSLRLVTLTAPYFHDGSIGDLNEAIRLMGRYQLGRSIPDGDVSLIAAFLSSLVEPSQLRLMAP